jgi:peptidyl-prolyl cis-trans isomerase C
VKKKDLAIALTAILLIAAVAYGLSRRSLGLPLTPSSPFKAVELAGKKTKADDNVVMRVNGQPITESEFNTLALAAPADARAFYATPAGRRAMADELTKLKALQQEGERMKLGDDPAVQAQLAAMRDQIIAGKALEKLVEKRAEPMILKAYAEQKGKGMVLRHIAIAYDGGQIPPRDPEAKLSAAQAMAKGQELVKKIRGGQDFGASAAAASDDLQSAQKGGMLGPMDREQLPQMLPADVAAVVAKLKVGEISDPLKTQYAVHIFKTEEPSLEDMRPMLTQQVKQQAAQEEIERLQKAAKVDLDPKFFPPAPFASPSATPPSQQKPQ